MKNYRKRKTNDNLDRDTLDVLNIKSTLVQASSTGVPYTLTLPSANGTVATAETTTDLTSSQTVSGLKNFTGGIRTNSITTSSGTDINIFPIQTGINLSSLLYTGRLSGPTRASANCQLPSSAGELSTLQGANQWTGTNQFGTVGTAISTIQFGSGSTTATVNAGAGSNFASVTFSSAFPSTPVVFVTQTALQGDASVPLKVSVGAITTTGFVLTAYNPTASTLTSVTVPYQWFALC